MLAAGRRSRESVRPSGFSSWSSSKRRSPSTRDRWRRKLSKSATKARTEPGRRKRIVDIPRFHPRPIPPRDAFVADLDTSPPELVPEAPHAPPHQGARPGTHPNRRRPDPPPGGEDHCVEQTRNHMSRARHAPSPAHSGPTRTEPGAVAKPVPLPPHPDLTGRHSRGPDDQQDPGRDGRPRQREGRRVRKPGRGNTSR